MLQPTILQNNTCHYYLSDFFKFAPYGRRGAKNNFSKLKNLFRKTNGGQKTISDFVPSVWSSFLDSIENTNSLNAGSVKKVPPKQNVMIFFFLQMQDDWNFLKVIPLGQKSNRKEIYTIWLVFLLFCGFSEKLHFHKWTGANIKENWKNINISTTLADQKSIKIWIVQYVLCSLFTVLLGVRLIASALIALLIFSWGISFQKSVTCCFSWATSVILIA